MPRRPRLRLAGMPFHVIQRGHNRADCFFAERDYFRQGTTMWQSMRTCS